jgi:ribosomal protein S6
MSETENDVRIYELGYWFVPTIAEDAVVDQVTELKNKLSAKGVTSYIAEEAPYLREISYEMKKVISNQNFYFTEGYFGWMKFEMDPSIVETLKHEFELDPSIIRSILVQTVAENTVYTKRPDAKKREDGEGEVSEEASEEAPAVAEEVTAEVETIDETKVETEE